MLTPILILLFLTGPVLAWRFADFRGGAHMGGIVGLALAFVFFGIGHFAQTRQMVTMLPPWVPMATLLVYATGLLEFAIADGILWNRTRRFAGVAAVAVLCLFFPLNVYAAVNYIDYGGHAWGPSYLIIRAPLQVILIAWCYFFVVKEKSEA